MPDGGATYVLDADTASTPAPAPRAPRAGCAPPSARPPACRCRRARRGRHDDPAARLDRSTPALGPEGYRLGPSTRDGVAIARRRRRPGVFWGAQTLRQLLGPDAFRRAPVAAGPALGRARSRPSRTRPASRWRGLMLDVARHFMPKDGVLRYLDLLAAHKLNVLHLHLTDDQGWRIEIKRYPRLTEVGAWRARTKFGHRASTAVGREPARRLLHPGRHPRDRRLRRRAAYHRRPRDRHPRPLAGRHRRVSGTRQHRRHRHDRPHRLGHLGHQPERTRPHRHHPALLRGGASRRSSSSSPSAVRAHRRRRVPQGPVEGVARRPGPDRGAGPRRTRTSSSPGSSGTSTAG